MGDLVYEPDSARRGVASAEPRARGADERARVKEALETARMAFQQAGAHYRAGLAEATDPSRSREERDRALHQADAQSRTLAALGRRVRDLAEQLAVLSQT